MDMNHTALPPSGPFPSLGAVPVLGPQGSQGSQGSAPCPQPLPAPCPHLMPVLASDAHAHAVANSGVSSDGNYGGMCSTVIAALGTCHHSAIMGCWDGTEAEGEGGLERGPRLPTGPWGGHPAVQATWPGKGHRRSLHIPCSIRPGTSKLPGTQQACADRGHDHVYTRYSP